MNDHLQAGGMFLSSAALVCEHCLLPVSEREAVYDELPTGRKVFCCTACRAIYRMITSEGLGAFYHRRHWTTSGIPEALRKEAFPRDSAAAQETDALLPFIRGEGRIKEADLLIDGIRCASCIWLNEKVLERTDGVRSVRINFATHRALVAWDGSKITLGRIISRVRSIGYLARPYTPEAREQTLKKRNADVLIRLGAAVFLSMQLMIVSLGLYAGFFQGIDPAAKYLLEFTALVVCTPVLFYSGWPLMRGAARGLRNRTLNMDTLVILGAFSAYFLSIHHMRAGGEVYFDTSAMIVTLVLLGRYFEFAAERTASQAVSRLFALQPREARIVSGEKRTVVSALDVKKGDLLDVRPGELVPLDGIVKAGSSETNESLVTGESTPVEKNPGTKVIGGSLNGLGTMIIEVTRVGQETLLSRIARLVENAQASTAPIQRTVDRVSRYFIPFVIVSAFAAFFFWSGRATGTQALLNAVSVLVIACPCALGLATPLAILAGSGQAARKGILIKNAAVLELLHRVDAVVLDKTGTVTWGKLRVVEVRCNDLGGSRFTERDVVQCAASAERASEHLTGRAIVNYAREQGVALLPAEDFRAAPGRGIVARVNGSPVHAGKRRYLEEEGIPLGEKISAEAKRQELCGRTVVWVARDGFVLGIIALMDEPRSDARSVVERLRSMNIDVVMITGDNRATAHAVAEKADIREVRAGVLPGGKSEEVARLRKAGKVVAMVGDGINDAPALARADVGMAMSSGSDIAMESADVVLARPDLGSVTEALALAKKTFTVIRQNLFWAFFYNTAAITLAVSGLLTPIVAAAAMAMSSVTVVMNSLRLK